MRWIFVLILVFIMAKCNTSPTHFESVELTSKRGEKLYVNTLNWGVTDDHQLTIITKNKEKLRYALDTVDAIKGLEPFVYSFKQDTLHLYFDNYVSYTIKDHLKSIHVKYSVLDDLKYISLKELASNNNGYYSVPKRISQQYPSDMPKP